MQTGRQIGALLFALLVASSCQSLRADAPTPLNQAETERVLEGASFVRIQPARPNEIVTWPFREYFCKGRWMKQSDRVPFIHARYSIDSEGFCIIYPQEFASAPLCRRLLRDGAGRYFVEELPPGSYGDFGIVEVEFRRPDPEFPCDS